MPLLHALGLVGGVVIQHACHAHPSKLFCMGLGVLRIIRGGLHACVVTDTLCLYAGL
jgi:hypothetical protein